MNLKLHYHGQEFLMEFIKQLKAAPHGTTMSNHPSLEVSRAIDCLKAALQRTNELPEVQRDSFFDDVERICFELRMWLEAMESREIH